MTSEMGKPTPPTAEMHSRIHSPNEDSYVYTQTLDLWRKWAAPDTTEE